MIKPIVLVTWPIHIDFPLFRYNMIRLKDYFASIWIGLSNHHQDVDYSNFIRASLPFANFVEIKHEGLDWRNDSVNEVLDKITTNEPILFMEEDFLICDDSFFDKVLSSTYDFIYFSEGSRIHPAFSLIKRDWIEKTNRDFSAYPDTENKDHFGKFFDELPGARININELGVIYKEDYFHMNGLSQEYMNFKNDQPFYNKDNFTYYNYKCLSLPIENHPQFFQIEKAIETKYGHPEVHEFLDKFFPS